jgi:hypothetical protein
VFRPPDPRTGTRRQPSGNECESNHGARSVATAGAGFLVLLVMSIGTYAVALPAVAVLIGMVPQCKTPLAVTNPTQNNQVSNVTI